MSGEFTLSQGETLSIAVGGSGGQGVSNGGPAGSQVFGVGGGGGGTFVVPLGSSTPLLIAGGGGGAAPSGNNGGNGGNAGLIATSGGAGGAGGGGNMFEPASGGGGGGGLQDDGSAGAAGGGVSGGTGGHSFVNGAAGGAGANAAGGRYVGAVGGNGGFGGGGGGSIEGGGGGGGGFSGGNGGDAPGTTFNDAIAGGGTSFDSGINQQSTLASARGNGSVFIAPVDTPAIGGTVAAQTTTGTTPIDPFATATISDPNLGTLPETLTVTPNSTANGALSDPNATTDHSSISNGVYTVAGTAAQVQADLRGLVFTPAANATGQTTSFSVSATNIAGKTGTDDTTSVTDQALALPSTISGTVAGQPTLDNTPIDPFSNVTITDPNTSPTETVTVTPSNTANGSLSDSVGGTVSNDVYTVTGSPTAVTTALDALVFTPTVGPAGQTVTTGFTIKDVNSADQTTIDSNTSVVATAPNNPTPQAVTEAEGQTTTNLYSTLVNDVEATNSGTPVTITSIGLSNTLGFAYLDTADSLLTYTADGFQPSAQQPQDSFSYTASDGAKGTVAVTVTGANEHTQVGTTLTASSANTRLIGTSGNDTLNANAASTTVFAGQGNDTINVNAAKAVVHGGTGTNTIALGGDTSQDTIVLQQGGTDNITGFNLHNQVLDLTQVLLEAQKSFNASDFQVTDNGKDATLSYVGTPSFTGGNPLATLFGVGRASRLLRWISDHALVT